MAKESFEPLDIKEAKTELAPQIASGRLVCFVGSGISAAKHTELPTWDGFMTRFIEFCRELASDIKDEKFKETVQAYGEKSDPVQVATVLKDWLLEKSLEDSSIGVENRWNDWFVQVFHGANPNDLHRYIVGSNYQHIITSNYDNMLEMAANEIGATDLKTTSFTFSEAEQIATAIHRDKRTIIHVHGKAARVSVGEVVLTVEDYLKMIKKSYPGFTFTLQDIFFRYSSLFMGYGASDPHLEDLLVQMAEYWNFSNNKDLPVHYLVVQEKKVDEIYRKYKGKMRTKLIVGSDQINILESQYKHLLRELYCANPVYSISGIEPC